MGIVGLLETAIGLVLIYLLLSLICTSVAEAISQYRGIRGQKLFMGLRQMMGNNAALAELLLHHPQIRPMASLEPEDGKVWRKLLQQLRLRPKDGKVRRKPSRLDGQRVARAIVDMVIDDHSDRLQQMPSVMASRLNEDAIKQNLGRWQEKCQGDIGATLQTASEEQLTLAAKRMTPVLQGLWQKAGGVPERFVEEVAHWFDEMNDRALGWFKRHLSVYLIMIGFVVALLANADTINILAQLSQNPELRQQMVQRAVDQVSDIERSAAPIDERDDADDQAGGKNGDNSETPRDEIIKNAKEVLKELEATPLIGWQRSDPLFQEGADYRSYLVKFFGILLTAFALSLGAPFWFDMLRKLLAARDKISGKRAATQESQAQPALPAGGGVTGADLGAVLKNESRPADNPQAERYVAGLKGFAPFINVPDRRNAYWLARAAKLAYRNDDLDQGDEAKWKERVRKTCSAWQLSTVHDLSKRIKLGVAAHAVDTECFVAVGREVVVVSFRGTETDSVEDIVTDLRYRQLSREWLPDGVDAQTHEGFTQALDAIWEDLFELLKKTADKPRRIFFTGHSLGGALAALAAVRYHREAKSHIKYQAKRIPELVRDSTAENAETNVELNQLRKTTLPLFGGLYTIGQPRIANQDLAEWMDQTFGQAYVRVVNHRDVVPRMPLMSMGYQHAGQLFYFDETGHFHPQPGLLSRVLDIVAFDPDDPKAAMKETVGDHSAAFYVALLANAASIEVAAADEAV